MPRPFHMAVTGTTQGNMTAGCSDMQGREDTSLCQAIDHEIHIPSDIQTGLPTGKRVHRPLMITKATDKSSTKLYKALCTGERMSEVVFKYYRIAPTGNEEHYFTIKLQDAIIVSLKKWIPNCLDPSKEGFTDMEDLSFTYSHIFWTWVPDGIEAEDQWQVPK